MFQQVRNRLAPLNELFSTVFGHCADTQMGENDHHGWALIESRGGFSGKLLLKRFTKITFQPSKKSPRPEKAQHFLAKNPIINLLYLSDPFFWGWGGVDKIVVKNF